MASASKLKLFVDGLQSHGTYTFSREEAGRSLGFTQGSLRNALVDLAAQGRIVRLRGGLYVIVPLEYRSAGVLPPYYVGLLSAAEVHGAAHQRLQTAAPLAQWMAERTPSLRALDPRVPLTGAARVEKWAVVANVKVEPDL